MVAQQVDLWGRFLLVGGKDIGAGGVFGRDRLKEVERGVDVLVGVGVFEDVPVDENVHVGVYRRVDALVEQLEAPLLLFAAIDVRVHGQADEVAVPVL